MAQQEALFYHIVEGQLQPISDGQIAQPAPLIGYLGMEAFRHYAPALGVDLGIIHELSADLSRLRNSVDVFEACSVGLISLVDLQHLDGDRDQLLFVVMQDKFLLVKMEDLDDSVRRLFEGVVSRYQKSLTLEKFIYGVLERFLTSGKLMEEIDHRMLQLEEQVVNGQVDKALTRTIYSMRQHLMLLHNYFEQLIDIGEALFENENELFDPHHLHYFRMFIGKAERLSSAAQLKAENLVHLREALDAELNYTINQVMKLFTVITAIFMPLTLIVGWYGMNFRYMPELEHPMGYPVVFGGSVLLVLLIVLWFRRKKLM